MANSPIPVHLLPVELLGEIFQLTFPYYAFPAGLTFEHRKSLITFCLVCKRWRHAAVSTPSLWSSVEWDVENEDRSLVWAWLKRASGTPKILKVVAPDHQNLLSGMPQHSHFDCLFNVSGLEYFIKELAPWHSVHWTIYDINCLGFLTDRLHRLASQEGSWPEMRHLTIEILSHWSYPTLTRILEWLPRRSLQSLSLKSFYQTKEMAKLLERLAQIEIPPDLCTGLTSLYLDCCPSPWLAWDTIASCPNLVELGISVKLDTGHFGFMGGGRTMELISLIDKYQSKPILLEKLKVLKVIRMAPIAEPDALDGLCTPRLESFHLDFETAREVDPGVSIIEHIDTLVSRSNCRVKNVYLTRARFPDWRYFHELLGLFPEVEYLVLRRIRKAYTMVRWMDPEMPAMSMLRRIECAEGQLFQGKFQQWNSGRNTAVTAVVVEDEPEPVTRIDSW